MKKERSEPVYREVTNVTLVRGNAIVDAPQDEVAKRLATRMSFVRVGRYLINPQHVVGIAPHQIDEAVPIPDLDGHFPEAA